MTSYGDVVVAVDQPQPEPHRRRAPAVAMEALGYIGGVVVLVSSILIMNLLASTCPTSLRWPGGHRGRVDSQSVRRS